MRDHADSEGMDSISKAARGLNRALIPPSRCIDCGEAIYGLLDRCEQHEAEWRAEVDFAQREAFEASWGDDDPDTDRMAEFFGEGGGR